VNLGSTAQLVARAQPSRGVQVEDDGVRTLTTFALSFVPWKRER
jgi:hypothetical protein